MAGNLLGSEIHARLPMAPEGGDGRRNPDSPPVWKVDLASEGDAVHPLILLLAE